MKLLDEIKRVVKTGKVVYGIKDSESAILKGGAKYVFYSEDLEEVQKERVEYLMKIGKIKGSELKGNYFEMGEILGRDHPVGVFAVIDEGKAKISI